MKLAQTLGTLLSGAIVLINLQILSPSNEKAIIFMPNTSENSLNLRLQELKLGLTVEEIQAAAFEQSPHLSPLVVVATELAQSIKDLDIESATLILGLSILISSSVDDHQTALLATFLSEVLQQLQANSQYATILHIPMLSSVAEEILRGSKQ